MKNITHTYVSGKSSTTLIIPADIAKKYNINKRSNVIIEGVSEGILIRKLVV